MKRDLDVSLATRAARHHGVFSRQHAREFGFTRRMIEHRLKTERWLPLHPGVYTVVGTSPTWQREQVAACYWCRGVAAGRAAGHLFGLPGCEDPPFEVLTTDRNRAMPRCGIIVHQTTRLPTRQVIEVDGVPTTSIERTLMMLCILLSRRDAAIAIDNALYRGLTTLGDLDFCLYLTARQGRGGSRVLRDVIRSRLTLDRIPTTPLETVILDALIGEGLPAPSVQPVVYDDGGVFVAQPDFLYPEARLVIEGHSKLWHTGVAARERDVRRHLDLERLDHEVIYATWSDATRYRRQFADRVRAARERRIRASN